MESGKCKEKKAKEERFRTRMFFLQSHSLLISLGSLLFYCFVIFPSRLLRLGVLVLTNMLLYYHLMGYNAATPPPQDAPTPLQFAAEITK